MHSPAHIDGRNLVILREVAGLLGRRFEIVASGTLTYDGERLALESDRTNQIRVITPEEQQRILIVSHSNRIPQCAGYQLFLLQDPA